MALFKKKGHGAQKKVNLKFSIDCAKVVEDKVVIMRDFEKYLRERIKVDGKKGNLGTAVSLSSNASAILLTSEIPFSKRYLKYLTKKYLKKVKIAEYLRVVATDKTKYELKYLKIHNDEEEEEEA
jgi:large subunit ribosomal protein L22e